MSDRERENPADQLVCSQNLAWVKSQMVLGGQGFTKLANSSFIADL